MNVRPATSEDAVQIADIWNPVIRNTTATFNSEEKTVGEIANQIEARVAAGLAFLVTEDANGITGFASYGPFRAGIGYKHTVEHTVILGVRAQGQGIGRKLMAALEAHARDAGMHSMIAGIGAENEVGRAFHLAIGFLDVALLPQVGRKFGRWQDLHLMQKLL